MKYLSAVLMVSALFGSLACTQNNVSYKDSAEKALEQADLKGVSVSEDADKNTITLSGTLHSDDAKAKAGDVVRSVATSRVIANEISVQPVGDETAAKDAAAALDDGIEKNYKAALITSRLDKQHVSYGAKNGVLTLTGSTKTGSERQKAQQLASSIPHVQQVVNQIEVKP